MNVSSLLPVLVRRREVHSYSPGAIVRGEEALVEPHLDPASRVRIRARQAQRVLRAGMAADVVGGEPAPDHGRLLGRALHSEDVVATEAADEMSSRGSWSIRVHAAASAAESADRSTSA